ncbi:hypothetical protein L6R29_23330, partial [Myxococcota bacterium]|nr:hypothetical protein [Myxococcota bacterium]
LGASATIKAGNASLDFSGDTITAKSSAFSVETTTFEVKGTNATTLKLDDAAKTVTFEKANVRILNGTTKTDQANGLGNLILGYNDTTLPANPPFTLQRAGSHNLVVGDSHSYPTTAGIVAGRYNNLVGKSASILGGSQNQAYSEGSVILGGTQNTTGKANNTAVPFFGLYSTISGGSLNQTYGTRSSILGGSGNLTGVHDDASKGSHASVSGGQSNTASGSHASVSGGQSNSAKFNTSFICGGLGPRETTVDGGIVCQ